MSDSSTSKITGTSRRALARSLVGTGAALCLPAPVRAASEPAASAQEIVDARIEALVEAALAATPARLTPEQRLDVRRAVRDTQKTLLDVRKVALGDDVDPATVFQAKAARTT